MLYPQVVEYNTRTQIRINPVLALSPVRTAHHRTLVNIGRTIATAPSRKTRASVLASTHLEAQAIIRARQ